MNETLYCVVDETGYILAKDMHIETAMVLTKALFNTYYGDEELQFTVKRQKEEVVGIEA